jgi:serine phosphatase RsbU (regulator of sigma subunit)
MSVASELLLRLVPPTTFACDDLVLSAVLEPTYDVGGDAFDYSVDDTAARISIFDAVGHGLPACLTSAVTVSAIRAARRAGEVSLRTLGSVADQAIQAQWSDSRFVTAVLAELELDSGVLRYVNAGHPPPLVLRGGRVIHRLDEGRRLPLGLDDEVDQLGHVYLEPGDRVLFFTDGVIEARNPEDEFFGLPRLVQLTELHATGELATAEVLRRLSHAVLEHQDGPLADDATMLLAEWTPAAPRRGWP